MKLEKKQIMASKRFARFVSGFVRAYSFTFRLAIENEEEWKRHHEDGGAVLFCVWHQQFFAAIHHFYRYREYHPCVMISKSRDGEFIANVAEQFGWHPVRGSSSRGGAEALLYMIDMLKKNRLAGHVIDGPRGPAGIVKPGVIRMAQKSGAAIVPFGTISDKAWFFNSWDRFFVPKPFAKVRIRFRKKIELGRIKTREDFEKERLRLERIMRPDLLNF